MRIYFARHGESQANRLHEIANRGLRHGLTDLSMVRPDQNDDVGATDTAIRCARDGIKVGDALMGSDHAPGALQILTGGRGWATSSFTASGSAGCKEPATAGVRRIASSSCPLRSRSAWKPEY